VSTIVRPTVAQIDALIHKFVPAIADGLPIGVAVGYVGPGFANVHLRGKLVDQNNQPLVFNGDTKFELASVTKTFCASLYAYFVNQNAIASDATLGSYYTPSQPGMAKAVPMGTALGSYYTPIPLVTLANYTSGLPQDNADASVDCPIPIPQPYTIPAMFSYLSGNPFLPGPPSKAYAYSNLGFGLLAQAMATSQGGLYHLLQRSNILEPCHMNRTQMYGTLGSELTELPVGYNGQTSSATPTAPGWPLFPAWGGAGGLVSTPDDMLKWLRFNMGLMSGNPLNVLLPALQSPSTPVRATSIYNSQLGLAWFLSTITSRNGNQIQTVWKDGGLAGFSSYISFLQSPSPGITPSEAGVFVLTNSSGPAVYSIANDLLFYMSSLDAPDEKSAYPRSHNGPSTA